MEALRVIEMIAVIIAALAVAVVSVYSLILGKQWQRFVEQASRVLETDVRRTLGEVDATAQRARETLGEVATTAGRARETMGEVGATAERARDTLGKMDATLIPFALTVRRIERLTAAVATEALVGPALGKVTGWLGGLRKGVSAILRHQ